ncbi:hypothetical protein GCM10020227_40650 [Streptomyces flavovirens]
MASPLPLGPPTTGTSTRERSAGVTVQQGGDGAQQDVRRLQRLDTAGEERDQGVLRQPQPGAGGGAGGFPRAQALGARGERTEAFEVDAGVDDGHTGGVGLVEADELVRLLGGVRDEPVGGVHDLRLTDDPGGGLGAVTLGERGVLDLRHGVHRVDQRDAPALGGEPADLAGEPVVGVDEVVVAGAVAGPRLHHPVGEGAELGGQLLLGQPLVRTGVDVPHQHAGGHLHRGGQGSGGGPGEYLHLDADRGEPLGQLDDVDVHTAGVTGARLVQGRGVHGQHRDAARLAVAAGEAAREADTGCHTAAAEPGDVLAHVVRSSSLGA